MNKLFLLYVSNKYTYMHLLISLNTSHFNHALTLNINWLGTLSYMSDNDHIPIYTHTNTIEIISEMFKIVIRWPDIYIHVTSLVITHVQWFNTHMYTYTFERKKKIYIHTYITYTVLFVEGHNHSLSTECDTSMLHSHTQPVYTFVWACKTCVVWSMRKDKGQWLNQSVIHECNRIKIYIFFVISIY